MPRRSFYRSLASTMWRGCLQRLRLVAVGLPWAPWAPPSAPSCPSQAESAPCIVLYSPGVPPVKWTSPPPPSVVWVDTQEVRQRRCPWAWPQGKEASLVLLPGWCLSPETPRGWVPVGPEVPPRGPGCACSFQHPSHSRETEAQSAG